MSEKACFDRVLSVEERRQAQAKGLDEGLRQQQSPLEAAALNSTLWRPGVTLTVAFMDGLPEVQDKVREISKTWEKFANINFNYVKGPQAVIRISFAQRGSWSYLGSDALGIAADKPTMNYGWLKPGTPDDEYKRVVLHEFGHALGLFHEHQNPAGGIKWNKEAVYASLSGSPNNWDKATIDHNMFDTYSRNLTQFTEFDANSIMLYSFPSEWTTDGMSFPSNDQLSNTDIAFIRARYPGR